MNKATSPIQTLLIANRGEIACRVIKTAKKMGIRTVAVYSEADRQGLHVQMADDAIAIGGSASSESYLVIERIVSAAKQSNSDAVHPGFGFLSENANFANALAQAGIEFVGPGVHAMEVMGDKIESKKLAASAGVSTVPGHPDALSDAAEAVAVSRDIGFPVMLKASAGGGGKGMRIAWKESEVAERFTSAQNEARSAFGDDRVFAEKFIEQPRHIEIQVLADAHGNCIYLGERECSIQRRHQKVIEEAPSPFISEATRQAMGDQAVQLANAVNYRSAGTVEFIVDKEQNFYFLEMNTRLQVEHPVTEYITGLDLVEQMIKIAEGRKLPLQQNEVKLTGWALEARVYAEDPDRQFLPSIGRLTRYQPPQETDNVRVDTGVYEGGEISMYYDPMIAKLVTYGSNREKAIASMNEALNGYAIRGVKHNIPFLAALINHPEFIQGNLTTGFIDEHYPDGFSSQDNQSADNKLSLMLASMAQLRTDQQAAGINGQLHNHNDTADTTAYSAIVQGKHCDITATANNLFSIDSTEHQLDCDWQPGQLVVSGSLDQQPFVAQIDKHNNHWMITHSGSVSTVLVLRPDVALLQKLMPEKLAPDLSGYLLSPMPGLLIRLSVSVGEAVKSGQELAVVEAMKMENILFAERDAVVKALPFEAGSSLAVDDVIIEFE